jgi:hypothetical protein
MILFINISLDFIPAIWELEEQLLQELELLWKL